MVAVDVTSDEAGAKAFLKEKGITFTSLNGDWAAVGKQFGVSSTPTNFLIDQRGRILFKHVGFNARTSKASFAAEIEAMLARP